MDPAAHAPGTQRVREPARSAGDGATAHVAVVGGGIAGLAAAYFLKDTPARVTVFEAGPRIGGKLAVSEVGGIPVDEGAEAMLARRPEGIELARAVGLAGELVTPGTTDAAIWTRGRLHPMPPGQFMGVPGDLSALARSGVLSAAGRARAWLDLVLPATPYEGDVAVAAEVGRRFGHEVVDRLVEPMLGGVYAGRADELSFEATMPGLAAAARDHRTLTAAVRAAISPGARASSGAAETRGAADRATTKRPVFTTLAGGLGTLPPAVAAASGAHLRTGATVRGLRRTPTGWRLTVGSADTPEHVSADAVVIAVPARPASRLLRAEVPAAAAALGEIEYASMAIVTLVFPRAAFPRLPTGSGYLVPAVDRRAVKAVTFSTVKWPHLRSAAGRADRPRTAGNGAHSEAVRCSVGRIGEEQVLQRADADLVAVARAELAAAVGVGGEPTVARVIRWGGSLPQYTVGHLSRVARIRAAVAAAPGLAVCGAAYDGLGIPACIATARQAAAQIAGHLARLPVIHADEGK